MTTYKFVEKGACVKIHLAEICTLTSAFCFDKFRFDNRTPVAGRGFVVVISKQENLADAKVSARQQCMYEGLQRRNLQQINDMRFPIDD